MSDRERQVRIEQFDPQLEDIVSPNTSIRFLADGFGGDTGPAEGPLWISERNILLFNDMHRSQRVEFSPDTGVTIIPGDTHIANGMTRDTKGRLVVCERKNRRVVRFEEDGSVTVIASSFQGKRLNEPNDVVVKSDGHIYFTDPATMVGGSQQWDLNFCGVYRVSPDLGAISLVAQDFALPNGLAFSPDESRLYVADTRRMHIRKFEMSSYGSHSGHMESVFAELTGPEPGFPDGMKVDMQGNVYCGGAGGIWIMNPSGVKLGRIVHGAPTTNNMAFGGSDWKTLYFVSRNHLGSVDLKLPGVPVPANLKTKPVF